MFGAVVGTLVIAGTSSIGTNAYRLTWRRRDFVEVDENLGEGVPKEPKEIEERKVLNPESMK